LDLSRDLTDLLLLATKLLYFKLSISILYPYLYFSL